MNKSPDAFRTISEVADMLETPAHVLRFWESRFPQIRPVKRAGGRRYYRPADVALLSGIKRLLHEDGMTIRGVQKILREQGVRHVSGMQDDASEVDDDAALEAALAASVGGPEDAVALPADEVETAQIIALQSALRHSTPPAPVSSDMAVSPEADSGPEEAEAMDPLPGPALQDAADHLPPFPEPEPEVEWDLPDADDVADQPVDPPPLPMMAPVSEIRPVMADLFTRTAPPPPVAQEPVMDEISEAPMSVWAEDSDSLPSPEAEPPSGLPRPAVLTSADPLPDSPAAAPTLRITRIGAQQAAPVAAAQTAVVPEPAPAAPHEETGVAPQAAERPEVAANLTGPTLVQRLRALRAEQLSDQDRQQMADIRDKAIALRDQMAGPGRKAV